jgi:hypothetical protein
MSMITTALAEAPAEIDPRTVDELGDDILLGAARAEKVTVVRGVRRGAMQSHQARAWTRGGSVD